MFHCNLSLLSVGNHDTNIMSNRFSVCASLKSLQTRIYETYGLCSCTDYYILCNGKKIDVLEGKPIPTNAVLHVVPKTLGGKGGFGSMLRAIGAQIEKTTNREACRDLSGRRLRDINEEKRLKNWISLQADREKEAAERKKRKLERLCQEPKHEFKDDQYEESRSNVTEKMSNSIEQGLKASTSTPSMCQGRLKRKVENDKSKHSEGKKKKLWIDEEDSDTSDSEVGVDDVGLTQPLNT